MVMPQQAAAPFEAATRLRRVQMPGMPKPTGGGIATQVIANAGLLQSLYLPISITISGTLSAPNAYGLASAIRRLTVNLNNGVKVFDLSGIGFHWLLREMLGYNGLALAWTDAQLAVTTGTFRLDMIVPIAHNIRDENGLIMLQNRFTYADVTLDWATDTTLATGATVTATCNPVMRTLDVPPDQRSWPVEGMRLIHQCLEEQIPIAAAGNFSHQVAIGNNYIGIYYLARLGWTEFRLVAQQSNVFEKMTPEQHRLGFAEASERNLTLSGGAIAGFDKRIFLDFAGSDGLGQFGAFRDFVNANALTSLFTEINMSAADTLYVVRRQFVTLGAGR